MHNPEDYKDTVLYMNSDGSFSGGASCDARFFLGFSGHRNKQTLLGSLILIQKTWPNAVWIHGGSKLGFDKQVHEYILENRIDHKVFRPDYIKYPSKEAPLRRNDVIVEQCRILVICHDGRDTGGTYYTLKHARAQNKFVYRVPVIDWPSSKSRPF